MLEFILNDKKIVTEAPAGMVLVDFVRRERRLSGSAVACREGDCGACTLLVGDPGYRAITSCISPLGNANGKHVVTVEGLMGPDLNPIQAALIEHSATQCGFCTPGIVMALAGFFLTAKSINQDNAVAAMDGNICRCTGYKAIERALGDLVSRFADRVDTGADRIASLVACGILPEYFLAIPDRLAQLRPKQASGNVVVGGGTDLFVREADTLHDAPLDLLYSKPGMKELSLDRGRCHIGSGCSIQALKESELLKTYLPNLDDDLRLFASTQIRQQGSVGGNLVNASPIGDLTVLLLALDSELVLRKGSKQRTILLRDFYKGYKEVDLEEGEFLEQIVFNLPKRNARFNFEKVSRRTHLDIASVNSGCRLEIEDGEITYACLSVGGVAATPLQLKESSRYLNGRQVTAETIRGAVKLVQEEISPISDVRGSSDYKRLLVRQLLYAHFLSCCPDLITVDQLL